jgi:hypothetical protein
MQLIHDVKGISKLILIFLLLVAFAFGALISYVWTMGFYAPFEFNLPSQPTIVIQNVAFNPQDASFVNVTLLNPSYSPSEAAILLIEARTLDDSLLHTFDTTSPATPYVLGTGKTQTFTCYWNWANYTGIELPPSAGKNVEIRVLLENDMGEYATVAKPFVSLSITNASFNSTISSNSFNVTVQNLETSETYVNITSITVDVAENITADTITPSLPYGLAPGAPAVTFTVPWNWTAYRNQTVTINVHTRQGYLAYHSVTIRS